MFSSSTLREFTLIACLTLLLAQHAASRPQASKPRRIIPRDIPNAPPDYDNDKDTWERIVSPRCSTDQLAFEARGWAEAGVLANALHAWIPKSDFQNAMDTYMGTDSGPYWWSYRSRVQSAVNQDYKIHTGDQPGHTYVYVYCDEDDTPADWKADGDLCDGSTGAYTWERLGTFWVARPVTLSFTRLCPFTDDLPVEYLRRALPKQLF